MGTGTEFVVAAYAVLWVILLLYVVASGMRTARMAREAELLVRLLDEREQSAPRDEAAGVGR